MNRRDLITRGLQAGAAALFAGTAAKAVSSQPIVAGNAFPVPKHLCVSFGPIKHGQVVRSMIVESGDMWLSVRDRYTDQGGVVIAFDDGIAVDVVRQGNHWRLSDRAITPNEARDITEVKKRFKPLFKRDARIGDPLLDDKYKIRAWIKNGRQPDWNISIEKI